MRKSKARYVALIEINAETKLQEGETIIPTQMRKQIFDRITSRLKEIAERDVVGTNGTATVRVTQTYGDVWEVNEE